MTTTAISTSGLTKTFGKTRALDGLDLTVEPGEVHGFLGPPGLPGAAETVTRATLESLGERLAGGLPGNVAAQLPREIGLHLERGGQSTQSYGLREFYQRVADKAGAGEDYPDAAFHARAVVSVLRDALSPGELDKVADQLPDEYAALFDWQGVTMSS